MRRGTRWAVVAVLSVLAIAGCTGDSEAPPTTPPVTSAAPSPSETPSPTPTPDAATPPERPDMSVVDAATAEAVARYFLELYPYVYATGDLTEWKALSHPECIFCASVVTNVEEMVAAGETVNGALVTISDVITTQITDVYFNVELTAQQGESSRLDSSGSLIGNTAPSTYRMAVGTLCEDGTWRIRGIDTDVSQ